MPNPADSMPYAPCWDPWILKDKDRYRLFYLSGRTDQEPWWKTSWICEAQSSDMRHWEHLGPILQPLNNQGWESGRLFAGSAYKEADTYYLFYSAACESDISAEAIGLATSTDGLVWQRLAHPLLSLDQPSANARYAGRCNWSDHLHWRDPYVVKDAVTQRYYLFCCASLTGQSRYQGGVGVAIAHHIAGPYQLLPPVAGPGIVTAQPDSEHNVEPDDSDRWPFYHLERPQVIYFQGQYHLFFSCFKEFVNPLWLAQVGADRVSDSTLYWYVSDAITGPFKPTSLLPVVPGSEITGLYGTTFSPLPTLESWQQLSDASDIEMTVLGWYSKDYRLAVTGEFYGIWNSSKLGAKLQIVAGSEI
ncbi:MAG: beta-fructosidase [Phormidesmis sp. RL_2_1]|nr:beta-fructosidase [Phormidesmis sp. RL_2_1]